MAPPVYSLSELSDDPIGGMLHDQLVKAREMLHGVEENLSRLVGPAPPPPPPERDDMVENRGLGMAVFRGRDGRGDFDGRGMERKIGLGASFESGGKRNFRAVEDVGGGEHRRSRPLAERLGIEPTGEPPFKRRAHLDFEEAEEKKPTLSSTVVKTGNEARTREEAIRNGERDKQTNARNRRMFGCLLGTLKKFQQEETELKPKEQKRALIEKKVEEKSKQEREKTNKLRRDLMFQKKNGQQEIKRIEYKMHRLKEANEWAAQQKLLQNFIRTKAEPHIFFLPKIMNGAMTEKLEATKVAIDAMIKENKDRLYEEFEKVDQQAEARAQRQITQGADQGWRRSDRRGNDALFEEEDGLLAEDSHAKLAESVNEIMGIQAEARQSETQKRGEDRAPPLVKREPETRTSVSPEPEGDAEMLEPIDDPVEPPATEKTAQLAPASPTVPAEVAIPDAVVEIPTSTNVSEKRKKPEKPAVITPSVEKKQAQTKSKGKNKDAGKEKKRKKRSSSTSSSSLSSSDSEDDKKKKKKKQQRKLNEKEKGQKKKKAATSSSSSENEDDRDESSEDERPSAIAIKQEPLVKIEKQDRDEEGEGYVEEEDV